MKRLSILLSLALVLMLSMGAFAALSTNITGWVEMDLTYKQDDPDDEDSDFYLNARARGRAQLSMSSGSSGNPKVTITMDNADTGNMTDGTWIDFGSALSRSSSVPFNITGMKLEATGAYWKDGPSLNTVIGTHTASWSKYTAWQLGRNSIHVSGLSVGPLNVQGIYSYSQAASRYNKINGYTGAVHVSGDIDMLSFNGYVTNVGASQTDSENRYTNFTVDAAASPVSGLNLSGVFSHDAENEGTLYKAEATVNLIDNFTFTGLVRLTDEKYNPQHSETHADHRIWWSDEKVYKVTANTQQAGVKLDGSFELKNKYSDADYQRTIVEAGASTTVENFDIGARVTLTDENDDKTTKTVLDAKTTLADITLTYKGTIETDREMRNELGAATTVDLIFADNVKIDAKVILDNNPHDNDKKKEFEDVSYGIDFKWTPPMGIDLTVGYANYNKSGNHVVNHTGKDGFYIRAHKRITF